MAACSPIFNVHTGVVYPAVHFTAGLNDPRVSYREAANLAVKLREATNANPRAWSIFSKVDLDSGNFLASDRYKYCRDHSF